MIYILLVDANIYLLKGIMQYIVVNFNIFYIFPVPSGPGLWANLPIFTP